MPERVKWALEQLNLRRTQATEAWVIAKYCKILVQDFHPDKHPGASLAQKETYTRTTAEINAARDVLLEYLEQTQGNNDAAECDSGDWLVGNTHNRSDPKVSAAMPIAIGVGRALMVTPMTDINFWFGRTSVHDSHGIGCLKSSLHIPSLIKVRSVPSSPRTRICEREPRGFCEGTLAKSR